MSSVFGGMKGQKINQSGTYIQSGEYWLKIEATKMIQNRAKVPTAVIEGTVVKTFGECQHRLGETVSRVSNDAKGEYLLSDCAAFVTAMLGMNQKATADDEMVQALQTVFEDPDGKGPFCHHIAHVKAWETTTKQGKPFTKIKWLGEIDPAKALEVLSEEEVARFWPNGELQKLAV